jgi:broad-specificity NMP kinase
VGGRNFLIEGGSCTGKTSVCEELQRRGYHAVNGDRLLAYQGDPEAGEPVAGMTGAAVHDHHVWDVGKVEALVADDAHALTFLCGGSRNFSKFIDLLDGVFILDIDLETLNQRLDARAEDEWGGRAAERELVERLHETKQDMPTVGTVIDATAPVDHVVDEILRRSTGT